MRKAVVILTAVGLAGAVCGSAAADVMLGTWDSDGDLLPGVWSEVYGGDGPGQPGCGLSANDGFEESGLTQWRLTGLYIPSGGGAVKESEDGTITTWKTVYTTDPGFGGGEPASLELLEAPGLWGEAVTFTDVEVTIWAEVDYGEDPPLYLGGVFEGTGVAGDLLVEFSGAVERSGFDAAGHWGTVPFISLTLIPEPTPLVVLGLAGIAVFRARRWG